MRQTKPKQPKIAKSKAAGAKEKTTKPKATPKAKNISDKDAATERGEPYINVVNMSLNPNDIKQGMFELEYNSIFVDTLRKEGYQGTSDDQIIDQWFTAVCRNVALATFEQEMADPDLRAKFHRKDLGDGRSEVS
jgi:hypothetical protein